MIKKDEIEVVMMTQKKLSIMVAVEDYTKMFDLVVLANMCDDSDFYLRLADLLNYRGTVRKMQLMLLYLLRHHHQ